MKYFKYIIILILFLICTLLYIQIKDYDNISNSLLSENQQTTEKMKKLSSSVDDIKEHSLELQQKINILYSIIDAKEIEIEMLEDSCILKTDEVQEETLDDALSPETTEITPNMEESTITLENENEVTGF